MSDNVFYVGEFDDSMQPLLLEVTNEIRRQAQLKYGYIDLYITSPGGNYDLVTHFIELVEIAKRDGVTVRTIVPSGAYSAGSMLAITGTPGERYIGKNAHHLVHYGYAGGLEESTPLQTSRAGSYKTNAYKAVLKHYQAYCTNEDIEEEMRDDLLFLPAAKCIKWGLADKYMSRLQL